jgi:hypothetical protein
MRTEWVQNRHNSVHTLLLIMVQTSTEYSVPILYYFQGPRGATLFSGIRFCIYSVNYCILYQFCTYQLFCTILYLFCTCSVPILYRHSVLNFHQCTQFLYITFTNNKPLYTLTPAFRRLHTAIYLLIYLVHNVVYKDLCIVYKDVCIVKKDLCIVYKLLGPLTLC